MPTYGSVSNFNAIETSSSLTSPLITSTGTINSNILSASSANITDINSTGTITTPKFKITPEGGFAVKLTNATTGSTIKGTLVSAASSADSAFNNFVTQYDCIGSVYETGIAVGSEAWVVTGGIAEILLVDGTSGVRRNFVYMSTTPGRGLANLAEPAGGGFTNAAEHFKEIGHCLETQASSTNVLCKILIHFN